MTAAPITSRAYGGVNAGNVGALVEGAIFTRGPKDKKNTAIFIGGGNMAEGQALLEAVRAKFFAKFRVSVMFDCNGSNTTAAAAVAWLAHGRILAGKRAVVLAGTGPVGQRAAALLASEGAAVAITGRKLDVVQAACDSIKSRFGAEVRPIAARAQPSAAQAVEGAHIVLATGAAGITLLEASQWQTSPTLELVADANASPPAGIEGVSNDRGTQSHGKILFGPLGFGALKLALHRACIGAAVRAERSRARCRTDLRPRQRPWSVIRRGPEHHHDAKLHRPISSSASPARSHAGRRQRRGHHGRHGCGARLHGVQRVDRQEGLRGGRARDARGADEVRGAAACASPPWWRRMWPPSTA
jgi:hypothetical protein